jgi:MarR-like DNA-binding transcriptional regulator SgrR of sgrS sRNA
MKLIDKIKNYFYDEEEVEVKADNKSKIEDSKVKAEVKTEKKDTNVSKESNIDAISERDLFKSDPTFNFPIIFDDEDFKEEKASKASITPSRLEQTKVVERTEAKVFRPSLNISPIYGIIDESKKSESITSKKEDNLLDLYNDKKKVNIDDVLDKVYSQKRVDLKSENYNGEEENIKPSNNEDLVLDFFNNNETRESKNNDIMDNKIANVDEKLKSIDELLENTDEDDFYSLVDSMYKGEEEDGDK